jgi:hypothetical protein
LEGILQIIRDKMSLGTVGKSRVGILDGGISGQLPGLQGLAQASGLGMDIGSIASSIAGRGIGAISLQSSV